MRIYPVDMKRANEFGQTFEKEKVDEEEEDREDQKTASNVIESKTKVLRTKKKPVKSD